MATHILDLSKAEMPETHRGLPGSIPLLRIGREYQVEEDGISAGDLQKLREARARAAKDAQLPPVWEAPIIVSPTKLPPGAKIRKIK